MFEIRHGRQVVAKAKSFEEALRKATTLVLPEKDLKELSKSQIANLSFDIVEV